ncbi:hypothetical protein W97_00395 [Coniosporium apollinis CBS 100218]|uniref:Large ribosomal subunit protein uL23m n=1 Tax=Coniosporium apollinis (strain CBS 100218) TaxID=1168221 RepID=R7YH22_CONA1|nr:uncharacterized protein W97_00395 [Coniosporium apollinis CBS 100218]EON61183.1 hypothetical protein W97_00395 [Coniosporium apollinis CBS 100218]
MRPAFRIVDTVRGQFALGTKEIYLSVPIPLPLPILPPIRPPILHTNPPRPTFTITLLRSSYLPPTFAKFMVPLNLNKLDLRDYLYNAYGVKVLSVRSFVAQSPVRQDKPDAERPKPRKWYRERAKKYMVAELERPFVWPDVPEDFSPWDKETHDAAEKEQEAFRETMMPDASTRAPGGRDTLAEQARRLLEGKERWQPTWQALEGKKNAEPRA